MQLVDIPKDVKIPVRLIRKLPKRQRNTTDVTGWILGDLRVIGYIGKIKALTATSRSCRLYWLCQCQCSRYRIVRTNDIKRVTKCRYCTKRIKKNPRKIGRDFRVNFRASFDEREQLRRYAKEIGISLQDFCIQTLLNETKKYQSIT